MHQKFLLPASFFSVQHLILILQVWALNNLELSLLLLMPSLLQPSKVISIISVSGYLGLSCMQYAKLLSLNIPNSAFI